MKVIALISSPRKGGNTDILTDEFLRGAADMGAETEKVYMDDLHIRPIAEVGDVVAERVDQRADDDAPKLLERVLDADVVLFGAPVYWQGVPAQLKCFVDRFSCYLGQSWFKQRMRGTGFAVICTYGAPDPEEAKWVTEPIKVWARFVNAKYIGDVCVCVFKKGAVRGNADALRQAYEFGRRVVEGRA